MADKMRFDLVSPERMLASEEVDRVVIPGAEGDMTALANHSPVLTTLRPGLVSVVNGGSTTDYVVSGGFAEVNEKGASVLAEEAVARADVTADWLAAQVEAAEEALSGATEDLAKQLAAQRVADLKYLGGQLGL